MRTTLILNDALAAAAKELAAKRRITFGAVVDEGLRRVLSDASPTRPAARFTMPMFSGRGAMPIDTSPVELDGFLNDGLPE